jgi:hypothetical protein
MDERPDEIMNQIESQRDQLGRNLNELEARVKRTTDWRAQFDRNPMLAMGIALGGGLLIGSMVGGSGHRIKRSSWSSSSSSEAGSYKSANLASSTSAGSHIGSGGASSAMTSSPYREHRRKTTDTLEQIKAALIAFGTAKVKEFMSEALPGFQQHLADAERRGASRQSDIYGGGSQYPSSYTGSTQSTDYPSDQGYPSGTRTEQSSRSPYSHPTGSNSGYNV